VSGPSNDRGPAFFLKRLAARFARAPRQLGWAAQRAAVEYRRAFAGDRWSGVGRLARRQVGFGALKLVGRGQSEDELVRASVDYWNDGARAGIDVADYSHWQGAGPWQDRERWLQLGRGHFRMYEQLALVTATSRPVRRVVEWGSGGGANAIHFIGEIDEFCGIEIAQASLDECARVLSTAGFRGFRPVLIPAEAPERAAELAGGDFDLFLSTYVFELLPGKRYGERVLRAAFDLLRPGGLGIVQIRYDDGTHRSRQKTLDYFRHATRFTSYRVEEFWMLAEAIGFRPEYVMLAPRQTEEFSGDLYAYYALVKPHASAPDLTPESPRRA
jgi:SAM-dependent methyltransferase